MDCPDVNVLVYAHRADSPEHTAYADWLKQLAEAPSPFALSELVLFGFLRIVTNRAIFRDATPLEAAIAFVRELLARPTCRRLRPGPRHLDLFFDLCLATRGSGKLTSDAHHAALAIEHGAVWITADGDFARFPGLSWRHPFAGEPA